jgi:hypothetical protein
VTDIAARDGPPLMSWSRPLGGQAMSSGLGYPKSLKIAQSRLLQRVPVMMGHSLYA